MLQNLFTAVEIPTDIKEEIMMIQNGIFNADWIDVDNMHISMSFMGNVYEHVAEEVFSVLSSIDSSSFEITLNGLNTFTRGFLFSHLWVSLEPCKEIKDLKRKIDSKLRLNGMIYDNRKYTPHLKIARIKHANEIEVVQFIQKNNLYKSRPFKVEDFVLYKSIFGKFGTFYEEYARFPLADKLDLKV